MSPTDSAQERWPQVAISGGRISLVIVNGSFVLAGEWWPSPVWKPRQYCWNS